MSTHNIGFYEELTIIEQRHEKTGFLHMRKQRRISAAQHLCFAIPISSAT